MMKRLTAARALPGLALILAAATPIAAARQPDSSARQARETSAEAASAAHGPWRPLVKGADLSAWRGYKSPDIPAGWTAARGVLTKSKGTGDLITKDQFSDFELTFDWRLSRGGNAGVFYRGTEEYDHIYWSGPEYQLLDDAHHADGRNRLTSAAAAYGIYPSRAGVVKAANHWNSSRLIVRGAHVEHWLNGHKLVDYELWSPDWEARVKASKFNDYPNYGRAKQGYIGIQGDHDGVLSLRNIRIRELSR